MLTMRASAGDAIINSGPSGAGGNPIQISGADGLMQLPCFGRDAS